MTEFKRYHSAQSHLIAKIKPENLIVFDSEGTAQAYGFRPSSFITPAPQRSEK